MITLKVSKDEALDNLNEAQTKLEGAIHLLRQTFDDEYVRSYFLAPLEIIASGDHEWVSRDPNLEGLYEQVEELEEPEPDPDAYYAQQEREHHAALDAIEDEREVQAFFDDNGREPSPARPETMWDHLIHLSDPVMPDDFRDSLAGQTLLQLGAQEPPQASLVITEIPLNVASILMSLYRELYLRDSADNPIDVVNEGDPRHAVYRAELADTTRWTQNDMIYRRIVPDDPQATIAALQAEVTRLTTERDNLRELARSAKRAFGDMAIRYADTSLADDLDTMVIAYFDSIMNEAGLYRGEIGMGDEEIDLMQSKAKNNLVESLKKRGWTFEVEDGIYTIERK